MEFWHIVKSGVEPLLSLCILLPCPCKIVLWCCGIANDNAAIVIVSLKNIVKLKIKPLVEANDLSAESDIKVTSVHVKPRPKAPSTLLNTSIATPKSISNPKLKSVASSLSVAIVSKEMEA